MGFVESSDYFGIYNDLPIDNQIRHKQPDRLAFVLHIEASLLVHGQAQFPEFENQRSLACPSTALLGFFI